MKDYLEQAKELLPSTLAMLEDLVLIDTGTRQTAGIERAGEILASAFRRLGFTLEKIPAGEFGQHLVARRPGNGRPLLLIGHLDTVYPPGSARRPAAEGDRLSGPGVYDCKGGLMVGLMALNLWEASDWPSSPLTFIVNADEEVGSPTSRPLIEAEARLAKAALIVEPAVSLEKVVTARRGIGRYLLRVFGRAAHSGADRSSGVNALVELAVKILALERLNDEEPGISVTVGTASGGVRPNIVPDYAQAEIDLRIGKPEDVERAEKAIRRAASSSQLAKASYRLDGGITRPPMPETEAIRKLFALAREAAHGFGLDLVPQSSGGGSDANFCAAAGLATLDGLGPAGGGAHTEDEYLLPETMPIRAALLAELGLRLSHWA